jgi:hypothetical protein
VVWSVIGDREVWAILGRRAGLPVAFVEFKNAVSWPGSRAAPPEIFAK